MWLEQIDTSRPKLTIYLWYSNYKQQQITFNERWFSISLLNLHSCLRYVRTWNCLKWTEHIAAKANIIDIKALCKWMLVTAASCQNVSDQQPTERCAVYQHPTERKDLKRKKEYRKKEPHQSEIIFMRYELKQHKKIPSFLFVLWAFCFAWICEYLVRDSPDLRDSHTDTLTFAYVTHNTLHGCTTQQQNEWNT